MDIKRDNQVSDNDIIYVNKLLEASQKLIQVNTNPPIYLSSTLLSKSDILKQLSSVYCMLGNRSMNQGYPILLELYNEDNMSRESWEALNRMTENSIPNTPSVENTTIDDVLYLLNKYKIAAASLPFNEPASVIRLQEIILTGGIFPRLESREANPIYYDYVVKAYLDLLSAKGISTLESLYKNHINLIGDVFTEYVKQHSTCNMSKKR